MPRFTKKKWNKRNVRNSHNCYSYMLNDLFNIPRIHGKPQPGAFNKKPSILNLLSSNNRLSCKQVLKGVRKDNPHMKVLSVTNGVNYRCKPGYYKGFMMVSPGNDFHFARQDKPQHYIFERRERENLELV